MKVILVFFTLTFANLNECMSQKNYYKFSDSILVEIDKAITKLDSIYGRKNSNYFLLMEPFENETLFIINYCSECPISKLIQSSNRFTLAKAGKFEIPIIFSFDLKYSVLLKDEAGHRMMPGIGGYGFRVGRRERITSRGFQQ
jgi:hypothetical protein